MRDILNVATALVYVARNKINGKCYIGATDRGLDHRRSRHFWNAKFGNAGKFYTAIRKHGKDAFEFSALRACSHFFDALEWERHFIAEMKPEYNLTAGGGGVKGLKFSDESRKKMAKAKRGKPNHWSGGKMPPEIREKLANLRRAERGNKKLTAQHLVSLRKNAATANEARRVRVRCITDGLVYNSVTEAAKAYGKTTGQISAYCRKGFASRSGLRFAYIEGDDD